MSRLAVLAFAVLAACKVKEPPASKDPFADNFERDALGQAYYRTGDGYAISGGALSAKGAHNHPLWLTRKLPRDVKIELDAWSTQARGDIKIEVFGDGRSFDPDGGAYMATGYELIFGGWYNTKSVIAKLDEHGNDMATRTDVKVVANKRYHWKIERKGKQVRWFIDDMASPFLQLDDPTPLEGPGHEYLGFNNWETDTWFDNLVITPL
ncbi:MAG: hypothetical protein ABI867_08385 [Kofleriaceae bacterium]